MSSLSDLKKGEIVRLLKDGSSVNEAAETLGVTRRTVARWWNRYQEEGEDGLRSRRKNCGRKKATTDDQDEAMVEVRINDLLCASNFPVCRNSYHFYQRNANIC